MALIIAALTARTRTTRPAAPIITALLAHTIRRALRCAVPLRIADLPAGATAAATTAAI